MYVPTLSYVSTFLAPTTFGGPHTHAMQQTLSGLLASSNRFLYNRYPVRRVSVLEVVGRRGRKCPDNEDVLVRSDGIAHVCEAPSKGPVLLTLWEIMAENVDNVMVKYDMAMRQSPVHRNLTLHGRTL